MLIADSVHSWNQVSIQESTSRILPNIDAMHSDIRRLATNLDIKIHGLQQMFSGTNNQSQIEGVKHLKDFVQSAATVLSSSSTILSSEQDNAHSEDGDDFRSDFGDWFRTETNASTLDWIYSSTGDTPLFDFAKRNEILSAGSSPSDKELFASPTSSSSAIGSNGNSNTLPREDFRWSSSTNPSVLQVPSSPAQNIIYSRREEDFVKELEDMVDEDQPPSELPVVPGNRSSTSPKSALPLVSASTTKEHRRSLSSLFLRKRFASEKPVKPKQEPKPKKASLSLALPGAEIRRKFMFVGDGACGKTCFLMSVPICTLLIL